MRVSRADAEKLGLTPKAGRATSRAAVGPSVLSSLLAGYCSSKGHPDPVPEHPFHPARGWLFDFAWPARKVALEVEGLTGGSGGRHQRKKGYEDDCRKYTEAALLGWVVVRATYPMIRSGEVYGFLDRAFQTKGVNRESPVPVAAVGQPARRRR